MKYQTKLIMGYAAIALALSLILGIVVYKISLDYEVKRQENSLNVTSGQLVLQMEDQLNRMDAIIYYILSDMEMLDAVKTLGLVNDRDIPSNYVLNATSELNVGFNTEYILQNSYRTLFYNQCGYLISSFAQEDQTKPPEWIDLEKIPYLEKADQAKGKSVFIGAHSDVVGGTEGKEVYSVMKAVQGYQMGYIEIENTIDSLSGLEVAEPDTGFYILANGEDILYSTENKNQIQDILKQRDKTIWHSDGMIYSKSSSKKFDFSIVACISERNAQAGRVAVFVTAVIATVLTFGLCFIMLTLFSFTLAKPVRELRKMIDKTSLDNLGVQSLQKGFNLDEVQMLAESYKSMTERLSQAVNNEKRSLMLQLEAQFDTLQAQINPHFLYNVLNTISSRGVENDDDVICEMCGALANLLRYSTNNIERYARVSQEIQYLGNYLYLLKARHGEKVSCSIHIEKEVEDQIIPKMTLYQFVENVFTHGYRSSNQQMAVEVTGRMYPDRWEICVRDNGEGIPEEKLKIIEEKIQNVREKVMGHSQNIELEIGGMGLINTYARCLLLYNNSLIFSIHNREKGVEVIIGEKRR